MNRLEKLCEERGLRMNDKRRVILRVLDGIQGHPDAEDIYRRARLHDPGLSIGTVYRTLNLLTAVGLLTARAFGGGRTRYEEATDLHHDHLIDEDTGAIAEFQNAELMRLIHETATNMGYRLGDYKLDLFGRQQDAEFEGARQSRPAEK